MEHPPNKPHYYCSLCNCKCRDKSGLETHIRHHTRERPFICDECKREFSSKTTLVTHLQHVHHLPTGILETKYNCSVCTFATVKKCSLKRHIVRQHTVRVRSFPCHYPNCEYAGKSAQNLKAHSIGKHTSDRKFLCKFPNCDYRGKTRAAISQHFQCHSENRPFSCDFEGCNHRSKNRGALKEHKLTVHHGGYKPFGCSVCNYKTTSRSLLREHELIHSEEKPFKCDFTGCAYKCKSTRNLNKHVLIHHTEKTFKCDFAGCSSTAASLSLLEKHKKNVHYEKVYKCPSCGFRAAYSSTLRRHLKLRHNARQRIPCPHKDCTFRSLNRESLKRHVRYHKANLGCPLEGCGYVGRSSSSLKHHMQIHDSTGRPFHCILCPKKFFSNGHLSKHLRTHTAEKPVQCPACHYKSWIKYNLVRHVRTFHSTVFPQFGLDEKSTCDHCHVNFGCAIGVAMHKLKLKTPGPSTHMTKALHVKRTWGAHFDKLLFMSSEGDERLGTIALQGVSEGRENLWLKTQKAFAYVWEHHEGDADWFMKVDDDTFIVSHNLRDYLRDLDPNKPHYLGLALNFPLVPIRVNYGGTGYILSKAALKLFLEALQIGGDCYKGIRQKYKGDEDSELAICLKSMNVSAENIADAKGRHQMIAVGYIENFDDTVANFNGSWTNTKINWSPKAISFHKVSPGQMYLLEMLAHTVKVF